MFGTIEIKELTKLFSGDQGIKGIDFNLKKGTFNVLIGHNGAGKTTLIRCLLGVNKEYSGYIKINGKELSETKWKLDGVSYIGENAVFPSSLSTMEYLLWAGLLSGGKKKELKNKIINFAKKVNIDMILNKNPNKLSSGQKRKVLLLKIMVENNDIIIMDEPTANLDPSARIVFFEQLKELNSLGKTILICSHNLQELEEYANFVLIIKQGNLVYKGKKTDTLLGMFKKHGRL